MGTTCGSSGSEFQYTAGTPEDVKALRAQLIAQMMSGAQRGATPYSGPMGTTADAGQLQAMNMLMGLTSGGKQRYTQPQTYSMGYNQPRMTSTGGYSPYPTPTPKPTPNPYPNPNPSPSPNPNPNPSPAPPIPQPIPDPTHPLPYPDPRDDKDSGRQRMNPQMLFQLLSKMRGM